MSGDPTARRLVINTGVYAAGEGLLQLLSASLAPVLTWLLLPSELGTWGLGMLLLGGLTHLVNPALHGAVTRFYFDHDTDEVARRSFQGTIFTFLLLWGSFVSVAATAVVLLSPPTFVRDVIGVPSTLLIVWSAFGSVLNVVATASWIARERSVFYVTARMVSTVTFLAIAIALSAGSHLGATGLFIAQCVSVAVVGIPLSLHTFRAVDLGVRRPELRAALAFSLPLVPHLIAHWLLALADRYMIEAMLGVAAVGTYTAAYAFIEVVNLIATAVNRAWVPVFTRAHNQPGSQDFVARTITYFISVVTITAMVTTIGAGTVVRLTFAPEYAECATVAPILAAGGLFQGVYYVYAGGLFRERNNRLLPVVTVVSALVNVALNLVLIPRWGLSGAAIATLVGYAVLLFGTRWACAQVTTLPMESTRLKKLGVVCGATTLVGMGVDYWVEPLVLQAVIKVAVLAVGVSMLLSLRVIDRAELVSLVKQLRAKKPQPS